MSEEPFGRYTFFKAGDLVRVTVPVTAFKCHDRPIHDYPVDEAGVETIGVEKVFPAGTLARLVTDPSYKHYEDLRPFPDWATEFYCRFEDGYSAAVHTRNFRPLSPLEQLALEAE